MIYPERASERIGEQADVPVPRVGEQIVGALVVGQQQVLLNGRWVTSTGGDAEYIKRSIASVMLGSAETSKTQADVDPKTVRDAEKYRDGEANKTEIQEQNCSENYCVNAEEYRDDEENKARINDANSLENYCVTAEMHRGRVEQGKDRCQEPFGELQLHCARRP